MIVALDGKCSVADGGDERKDAVFFPYVGRAPIQNGS